jgi:hypothetical protein
VDNACVADWQAEARRAAKRYGLDPGIFSRQIKQESGFNPNARSPAGALGIAQIMPATARGWGVDPLDPAAALNAAAKNMASYVRRYGGYENALRAYNAGPGNIARSHGFSETNAYVNAILNGHDPGGLGSPVRSPAASPVRASGRTGGAAGGPSSAPAAAVMMQPGSAGDFSGLLSSLLSQSRPQPMVPQAAPIEAPKFATGPSLPDAFHPLLAQQQSQGEPQTPVSARLGLLESLRGSDTGQAPSVAAGGPDAAQGGSSAVPSIAQTVAGARQKGVKLPSGVVSFEGHKVAAWIAPALQYARKHGWSGHVNSGWRSYAEQKRIYDSGQRPAAYPGTSNHEGSQYPRGAVDVWGAAQLASILSHSPWAGKLIWAGAKDPVHFSHPHNGGY